MKNKRFLSMMLCFVLVASLFTGFVSTASADDVVSYPVKDGDYLFKICKSLGLDYYQCKNAIMILNNFTSEVQLNRLTIGQTVKLPASNAIAATVKASTATTTTVTTSTTVNGTTTTTTSSSTVNGTNGTTTGYNVAFYLIPYVVQNGDTLVSICNSYGTNYAQYSSMILGMNNISSANNLWAGKTIYVPSTKAPASGGYYGVVNHVISSGETLTSICNNYGTSYASNAALINGLNSPKNLNKIYAGQSVYIPVVSTAINNASGNPGVPSGNNPAAQSGYTISFAKADFGDPYATIDGTQVSRADEGKTVQVVGNGEPGYAMKSITAIRTDTMANIPINNGKFTMPASNVVVTCSYNPAYRIGKEEVPNGSFSIQVEGSPSFYANYGDNVYVVPEPRDGYGVSCPGGQYQVYYVKQGETTKNYITIRESDGRFRFHMPNTDVKVGITFEKTNYYSISAASGQHASFTYQVLGSTITRAAKDSQVVIKIQNASGWTMKSGTVKYTYNDGGTVTKSASKTDDSTYYFTMPAADVTISAEYEQTRYYRINAMPAEGGSISFKVYDPYKKTTSYNQTSATAGSTVEVMTDPKSGYVFDWNESGVRYASGNARVDKASANGGQRITFVMPDADVNVYPSFKKDSSAVRYTISKASASGGSFNILVSEDGTNFGTGNKSLKGKTVRVEITPAAGKVVDKVTYKGATTSGTATKISENLYEFTMPGENVTVTVTFKAAGGFIAFSMERPSVNGVSLDYIVPKLNGVVIHSGAQISPGSVIVFTMPKKDNYKLEDVYVEVSASTKYSASANPDKIVKQSDGVYKYTVQSNDQYVKLSSLYSAGSWTVQHGGNSVGGSYVINGVNGDIAAVNGQKITLTITPNAGYEISKVEVGGNDLTETLVKSGSNYICEFTLGNIYTTTKVTFVPFAPSPAEKYKITVSSPAAVDCATEAEAGETVTFNVTLGTDQRITGVTLSSGAVSFSGTSGSFTMPKGDVTLTVSVRDDYDIKWADAAAGGFAYANGEDSKTAAKAGEVIVVGIKPDTAVTKVDLDYNGSAAEYLGENSGVYSFRFTVAQADAEVKVTLTP